MNNQDKRGWAKAIISINKKEREAMHLVPVTIVMVMRYFFESRTKGQQ